MNNVIVGGYIVRRAVNRSTRVLESSIQELGNDARVDPETERVPEPHRMWCPERMFTVMCLTCMIMGYWLIQSQKW